MVDINGLLMEINLHDIFNKILSHIYRFGFFILLAVYSNLSSNQIVASSIPIRFMCSVLLFENPLLLCL